MKQTVVSRDVPRLLAVARGDVPADCVLSGAQRVGLGFVHRSGLQRGALASTVAHDAHNVVVIGSSDDMLAAVGRLVELQGGIVAVHDRQVLAECALPIAGLLSTCAAEDVIAQSRACSRAAAGLGWTGSSPFMTLSFLALSVVPAL